jgi:hypothetical protein
MVVVFLGAIFFAFTGAFLAGADFLAAVVFKVFFFTAFFLAAMVTTLYRKK